MSWNIKTPGDYINGPLTVAGKTVINTHLGIGVTPSDSWGAGWNSISIKNSANNIAANGANYFEFCQNSLFTSSGSLYVGNNPASRYEMGNGGHFWFTAPFGSAGDAVAWNQRMTLDINGNLAVQNSNPSIGNSGGITIGTLGTSRQLTLSMYQCYARLREWDSANTVALVTNVNVDNGIDNPSISSWKVQLGAGLDCFRVGRAVPGSYTFAELMRVSSAGAVILNGGNVSANGIGVAFPSAQSASTDANTLDDYEEGTWSGNITGSTTNPTTAVTAIGRYTKIGRQVHLQIAFSDVNTTGASGTLLITGLPFANATGFAAQGSIASYSAITFTGSAACAVGSNESYMTILCSVSNAIWNVANHNAGTGRYLNATITYTVA
jgi:hypothetical protein